MLSTKAEELNQTLQLNIENNKEYEDLQNDLEEKMKTMNKWIEKKNNLETKLKTLAVGFGCRYKMKWFARIG